MTESAKLSEEQLYECFKSLNVPVRLSDLKTPTKEFVIQVFHTFLKDLQINVMNLISFEAIKHFENQEYYENGQMLFVLIYTMNEILQECSALTITLNDIVAPKPKRTKRIFNYLIIFWNYYLKKVALFENVEKQLQREIQKMTDLKKENELLDDSYLECVAKLRAFPSKEEIHKSYVLKDEQVKNLEQVRKEVLENYQDLKEEENKLHTQISGVDVAIVNTKEKLNELDQLIVSSPEKKKADIQKLKDMVKEVDQAVLEKDLEKNEKKKSFDSLVLALEDALKIHTKQQQKMYDELLLLYEKFQNICILCAKHEEEKRNLTELMSTLEMKEDMKNLYEQKCAKVQLSKEKQIKEISETIIPLQRQKEEEKNKFEKMKLYKNQLEKEINKRADAVIDVIKQSEIASEETARVLAVYKSEMRVIDESFSNSCKKILDEFKNSS